MMDWYSIPLWVLVVACLASVIIAAAIILLNAYAPMKQSNSDNSTKGEK